MTVPFTRALWGVCCGTRIFRELRNNSVPRTLLHLAMLSILCALAIAFAAVRRNAREWDDSSRAFAAVFGEHLTISERGIVPEKDPGVPRFLALPGPGGVLYTSASGEAKFPAGFLASAGYFAVWSDFCIVFGVRTGEQEWQLRIVRPDQSFVTRGENRDDLPGALTAELRSRSSAPAVWKLPKFRASSKELFDLARELAEIGLFVSEAIGVFVLAALCTALFAGISRLTGAAALRGFGGAEYWKIGVYAGFPGMLIGTAVEALDLPWLSYGIVYSLALVIYWLPASLACSGEVPGGDGTPPET